MSDERDVWAPDLAEGASMDADTDILRFLVEFAVLAPSGHNTQPWLFRIREDALELYADRTRALLLVDPADRELTISCGCALFNARVAAQALGRRAEVTLLPDPQDTDLLARLVLGAEVDPSASIGALCDSIPRRRTNRLPFQDKPVPEGLVDDLGQAAEREGAWLAVLDGPAKEEAADLVAEGDRIQMADAGFRRELAEWIHSNRSGSRDGMPGRAFGVGDLASMAGPFVIRTFDIGKGQAAKDREVALGSPLLLVLGTQHDDADSWIRAGQALERVLLTATSHGIDASYLNQPIEVDELRPRVASLTGRGGQPQLLIRMGNGAPRVPTPRRDASEVLLEDGAS